MAKTICIIPGCGKPRYTGPKGTNHHLNKCEEHQKQEWKEYSEKKKALRVPSSRRRRTPTTSSSGYMGEETPVPTPETPKAVPTPNTFGIRPFEAPPIQPPQHRLEKVDAPTLTQQPHTSLQRKAVKVLLLDFETRQMVHIEGQIVLDTPMPEDEVSRELLLEGYEEYIVVQRGEDTTPLMNAYEGR